MKDLLISFNTLLVGSLLRWPTADWLFFVVSNYSNSITVLRIREFVYKQNTALDESCVLHMSYLQILKVSICELKQMQAEDNYYRQVTTEREGLAKWDSEEMKEPHQRRLSNSDFQWVILVGIQIADSRWP